MSKVNEYHHEWKDKTLKEKLDLLIDRWGPRSNTIEFMANTLVEQDKRITELESFIETIKDERRENQL